MRAILDYIIWSPDPAIFNLPFSLIGGSDRPVVWYGLLFALGFIISQQIMYRIYRADGQSEKDVDILTTYMVIATIVGARLGHCLFYNPSYYLSDPVEILKIWEGGLASHGGALGILFALWLYANYDIRVKWMLVIPLKWSAKKIKRETQTYLWILDRIVIVVALTGAMIRTGNLMNSEMEGTATGSDYGLVYARGTKDVLSTNRKVDEVYFEKGGNKTSANSGEVPLTAVVKYSRGIEIDDAERNFIETRLRSTLLSYSEVVEHIDFGSGPLDYEVEKKGNHNYVKIYGIGTVRHPAQMYEAAYCLMIFLLLFWIWKNRKKQVPEGFNFALFMILLWSLRFVDEFFKMNQEAFEEKLTLNMGQILSIPLTIAGIVLMIWIYRRDSNKQTKTS
jgi:prolipoprotein diacylglyceryl transferase